MSRSYVNLLYHLVFSTKDRRPWIDDTVASRVHEYLGGTIRGLGGAPLAIGGMPDHVHILAGLRQDIALSDMLRQLKAGTSTWLHREIASLAGFSWQAGYAAFTVSRSNVVRVQTYIRSQAVHHRTRSFEEELVALLDAHDVAYDARWLWK